MNIYKNAALVFLLDIVLKAKTFITIPLLIHRYGTADYGVWTQITVFGTMLVPFVILGTDMAFQRYLSGVEQVKRVQVFWGWVKAQLVIGFCICSLIMCLPFIYQSNYSGFLGSKEILLIICLVMFSSVISNALRSFFNMQVELRWLGIFNSCQAVLFIFVVLFGFYYEMQILNLLICVILADALISIIMLIFILFKYGYAAGIDFDSFRKFLVFGLPYVPAQLLMLGMNYSDRFILPSYVGFSEIGKYAIVYQAGSMVLQSLLGPFWVLFPSRLAELVNKGDISGATSLYSKSVEAMFFIAAPAAVSLIVLGPSMIYLYVGLFFIQSALIMTCIGVGYYFHLLSSFNDVLLGIHMKQKFTLLSYAAGLMVNLISNFLLIPSYGISGAAIATFLGFLVQLLITQLAARFYWGALRWEKLVYIKISLMSLSLYLLYELVLLFKLPDIIAVLSALFFGSILYLSLALLLKLFTLQQLKGLLRV